MAPTGQSAASGIGRPVRQPPRPVRVAVVDRHEVVRVGLAALLAGAGRTVRLVATAATVGDLLHSDLDVHVVLLDAVATDGPAVAEAVRDLRAHGAAVLLYTADRDVEMLRRSVGAGAAGILPKTASAAATLAAITAVAAWQPTLPTVVVPATGPALPVAVGPDDVVPPAGHAAPRPRPVGAIVPQPRPVGVPVSQPHPVGAVVSQQGTVGVVADISVAVPSLSHREREALTLYASGLPLKSVARRMTVTEYTAKEYLKRVRRKYGEAGRPANTKLELYWRAVEDGLSRVPATGGGAVDTARPGVPGTLAPQPSGRAAEPVAGATRPPERSGHRSPPRGPAPVARSAGLVPPTDRSGLLVPPPDRSGLLVPPPDRSAAQLAPWDRSSAAPAAPVPAVAAGPARTHQPVRLPSRPPRLGQLVAHPAV